MSRRRWLSSIACAVCLAPRAFPEQPPSAASEYQVKAAFLYNFAKFVEWPARVLPEGAPLVLGVLGEDPFGRELDAIVAERLIAGRPIVVARFRSLKELAACHILFIAASEERELSRVFESLAGKGTLSVGETPSFAERGGVIGFTMEQSRIRFEINLAAAERAELRISAHLLRLARIVGGQERTRRK